MFIPTPVSLLVFLHIQTCLHSAAQIGAVIMYFAVLTKRVIGPGGLFTFFNWRLIFYSSVFC